MTNAAPERIWLMDDELSDFADTYLVEGSKGFVRIDHAQAELQAAVAAEREAFAESCVTGMAPGEGKA